MKRLTPTPRPTLAPILADAVYNKRALCAGLQWEHRTFRHAVQEGLRIIAFGKQRFILGKDVLAFFEKLAERQNNKEEGGQPDNKNRLGQNDHPESTAEKLAAEYKGEGDGE